MTFFPQHCTCGCMIKKVLLQLPKAISLTNFNFSSFYQEKFGLINQWQIWSIALYCLHSCLKLLILADTISKPEEQFVFITRSKDLDE